MSNVQSLERDMQKMEELILDIPFSFKELPFERCWILGREIRICKYLSGLV